MRHRKKHGRFWRRWHERKSHHQDFTDDTGDFHHDPRIAWRRHFAEHIGMPPEKHWLFRGRRFKPWISGEWGPPGLFNPFVADLMSKGGGLLPILVLNLLAEKPRFGNDIMGAISERTSGHWGPNPGAVYPLLSQMEEGGLVRGEWEDPDKRTRRIYYLTDEGHQELARIKEIMRPKLEEAITVLSDLIDSLE